MFHVWTSVIADTCVAMDEWIENPTAHTALDNILPCVDKATAHETALRSRDVQHQLVKVVNNIIVNVTNRDVPPSAGAFYFNQSGPLMPPLCNPFKPDLTDRPCSAWEVTMDNSPEVKTMKFSFCCYRNGQISASNTNKNFTERLNITFNAKKLSNLATNYKLQDCWQEYKILKYLKHV